jgi:hypothetical protein
MLQPTVRAANWFTGECLFFRSRLVLRTMGLHQTNGPQHILDEQLPVLFGLPLPPGAHAFVILVHLQHVHLVAVDQRGQRAGARRGDAEAQRDHAFRMQLVRQQPAEGLKLLPLGARPPTPWPVPAQALDCVLAVPHRTPLLIRADNVARGAAGSSKAAPCFGNCKMPQYRFVLPYYLTDKSYYVYSIPLSSETMIAN